MALSKCSRCWQSGPPVLWDADAAPPIPSTKDALLTALLEHQTAKDLKGLKSLKVPELKHLFKTVIRGQRHPDDPTAGMASMKKSKLLDRLSDHGLCPSSGATKGCMMIQLRAHWQGQCLLAVSHGLDSPKQSGWELVSEDADR